MAVNDSHARKASSPIDRADIGTLTLASLTQSANKPSDTRGNISGNSADTNSRHPANALLPTDRTPPGTTTLRNDQQSSNALSPISSTPSGINNVSSE